MKGNTSCHEPVEVPSELALRRRAADPAPLTNSARRRVAAACLSAQAAGLGTY